MLQSSIRNFCIIAHIDHGKSTLADRLLETTGTLAAREMKTTQILDTMELEQERGITIKLQPARMYWKHQTTGVEHELNLIDTPWHVDFQYEVSRSLAACEWAILVVDASQGIEAQTLATVYMALEHNLEIIPVINKIDLPHADPDRVAEEIERMFGFPKESCLRVSGKTGIGIEALLDALCDRIPAPTGDESAPLKALVFDSFFDAYQGVIAYIRIVEGTLRKNDPLIMMATESRAQSLEQGFLIPKRKEKPILSAGEIGYVVTGLKDVSLVRIGDTLTHQQNRAKEALDGYRPAIPMVYSGIFPIDTEDYPLLRDALGKLILSDSSLSYEPESSKALGFGFRAGFLGLLHMDIVKERLEREYNLSILITSPTVRYRVTKTSGDVLTISNPSELPDAGDIDLFEQPWADIEILLPTDFIGPIMELCDKNHGVYTEMKYIDEKRVALHYSIPMASIVTDFYDKLKSLSSGYASLAYEEKEYRSGDLVRLDILVAGESVDALCTICERSDAYSIGTKICAQLKEILPRQQFVIALQAAIGSRVIARETISALRKDVTAKLYGGDVSRKKKLLEKQKEGKKRMKSIGSVQIPQEAFLTVLKRD